jgi:hypothetical protein
MRGAYARAAVLITKTSLRFATITNDHGVRVDKQIVDGSA